MKKIKIKLILIVCLIITSENIHSQVGITGGINLSSVKTEMDNISGWEYSYKPGFQIGAFYELNLSDKFNFKPSLMLLNESGKRRHYDKHEVSDNVFIETFSVSSAYIPMIFSYKVPILSEQNLLIDAGLYSSFGLWGEYTKSNELFEIFPEKLNRFDFGYVAGVSYDTKKFNYSLHWKQGHKKHGYLHNRKTTFMLSIGYKLNKFR